MGRIGVMTVIWLIGNATLFVLGTTDFGFKGHTPMSRDDIAQVAFGFIVCFGPVTYLIGLMVTALVSVILYSEKGNRR